MEQTGININQRIHQSQPPLVVDLDGTLIRTDLLFESLYTLVKNKPFLLFLVPIWLLRGKAYLKKQIAKHVDVGVNLLPYHNTFLEYLHNEFNNGRELILATASFETLAMKVADYLGIFSDVLASNEDLNLSGDQKLKVLLKKYGERGFDYAGNAKPDLHIFPHARYVILVNPTRRIRDVAKKKSHVQQVFDDRYRGFLIYFKAIRVYQWVKNLLLFVPLLTSHQWFNFSMIIRVVLGFFAFSLCASSGYLFNDLLDLPSDRNHPRKKNRPFAAGDISIVSGSMLMILFSLFGLAIAAILDWIFFGILTIYLVLTLTYTVYLKTYVLIDVLVLAGLYTIRVIAGAEVIDVPLSFWLLAFSIFLFFSLALVKRCSELYTLANTDIVSTKGRDYHISDISYLQIMGIASGYLSVIVVALYINSLDVTILYSHPRVLWLICPILLYWVSRIWLKTGRGEMVDDPIIFSLKDRGSRYVACAMVVIISFAL